MRILFLVPILLLTGCLVTPVKRNFPESVPELQVRCPELLQIEGTPVAITDMLKTVVQNYNTYYQCANKVEGWNEWYATQKKIFESVK
jgi:hypothetical protein